MNKLNETLLKYYYGITSINQMIEDLSKFDESILPSFIRTIKNEEFSYENKLFSDSLFGYYKYVLNLISSDEIDNDEYLKKMNLKISKFIGNSNLKEEDVKNHFQNLLDEFFDKNLSLFFLNQVSTKLLYSKNGNINIPEDSELYSVLDDSVEWFDYIEMEFLSDLGYKRFAQPIKEYYLKIKN